MDKQFAVAVILLILGIGLVNTDNDPAVLGMGYGIIIMGSIWVAVRLAREVARR